jgi:hypothetical protein
MGISYPRAPIYIQGRQNVGAVKTAPLTRQLQQDVASWRHVVGRRFK